MTATGWLPTFNFQDVLQGEDLSLTENFSDQNSALEFFDEQGSTVQEDQDEQELWTCPENASLHLKLRKSQSYPEAATDEPCDRPISIRLNA